MSWFSRKAEEKPKLSYWDQLDADYPKGSEWTYLGKRVVILRTHLWEVDGWPIFSPRIQYLDHNGNIATDAVCLEALKPIGVES